MAAGCFLVYIDGVGHEFDPMITCKGLYEEVNDPTLDIYFQDTKIPLHSAEMLADYGLSNEVSLTTRKVRAYFLSKVNNMYVYTFNGIVSTRELMGPNIIKEWGTKKECMDSIINDYIRSLIDKGCICVHIFKEDIIRVCKYGAWVHKTIPGIYSEYGKN